MESEIEAEQNGNGETWRKGCATKPDDNWDGGRPKTLAFHDPSWHITKCFRRIGEKVRRSLWASHIHSPIIILRAVCCNFTICNVMLYGANVCFEKACYYGKISSFPFVRGEVLPATFSPPHLIVFSILLCLLSSSSSLPPLLPSSHLS